MVYLWYVTTLPKLLNLPFLCLDGETFLNSQTQINILWMKWCQVTEVLCDKKVPNHLKWKKWTGFMVYLVTLHSSEFWPALTKQDQILQAVLTIVIRLNHIKNDHISEQIRVAAFVNKMRELCLRHCEYNSDVKKSDQNHSKNYLPTQT